jgi:hypothetical protein
MVDVDVTRVEPSAVDLDLAEALVAVDRASIEQSGLELTHLVGPAPDHLNDGLVAQHEAINDDPSEARMEPDD